jgi:uncharacterized iron-regulated protein
MRKSLVALLPVLAALFAPPALAAEACVPPGQWRLPGRADVAPTPLARMAERPVVLLGENHAAAEHHRWQAQTLAALHAANSNLVIAFEMFPRRLQPVLDAWVRGGMTEKEFLERVEWDKVWRFDADLYLPLFHFARMNRLPMVAMNVDQETVRAVRQQGWGKVPPERREGVGEPAPASEAYRDRLHDVFTHHGKDDKQAPPKDSEDFGRFVGAQLLWDRAMAEAIAKVRRGGGEPLVVGIVGQGHLEYGHGIPHQLAALGIPDAAVLLPWDGNRECADLADGSGTPVATAVFGVASIEENEAEAPRPRLGVMIEAGEGGVKVGKVVPGSVAEAAGIKADDVIVQAAGFPVARPEDLIAVVRRQAPGTWLPLVLRRGKETLDLIGRFPPS